MTGDYQALVCAKSQLYRGQGLAAAVGFLPVSGMFSKIISDSLCSNPAGLRRVSPGPLIHKGMRARKVDEHTTLATRGRELCTSDFSKTF